MKGNGAAAKAIKGAVETKDYATVEAKAKDIMGTADKIVSLFPKGSTTGKTKATTAIWEKSDDFSKAAKNLEQGCWRVGKRGQRPAMTPTWTSKSKPSATPAVPATSSSAPKSTPNKSTILRSRASASQPQKAPVR